MTLLNLVAVWHIYAAAFLLGTFHAVNMPTRLAIVVNLVGREDIMNAVTLNSAVLNTGRVVGPAVAGGVIDLLGIAASLYLNALCYLLSVGFLLLIKGVEQTRPARRANPLRDLLAGLDYFRKTPVVFTIIGMGFAFGFFGMPHIQVMPAFAREALGRGAGEGRPADNGGRRRLLAGQYNPGILGQRPGQKLAAPGLYPDFCGQPVYIRLVAMVLAFLGYPAVRRDGQQRLHFLGNDDFAVDGAVRITGAGDEPVVCIRRVYVHRLPADGFSGGTGQLAGRPGRRGGLVSGLHPGYGGMAAHPAAVADIKGG